MDTSELLEIIKSRRAVYPKQMSGGVIPDTIIHEILKAANWAPTHRRTEPWRFKVYAGQSKDRLIDQCKECYIRDTLAEKFNSIKLEKLEQRKSQASHIIAVCMRRHEVVPEWEELAATAMAVQNMWLSLSSTEKYGGYWSTPSYAMDEDFEAFLRLDEDERCLGLFYLGEIAEAAVLPEGVRGEWREKVVFEG